MALASFSTASATSGTFDKKRVFGGASQVVAEAKRKNEPNTLDVRVTLLEFNGQSNFKYRGYQAGTSTACTVAKQITGTGYKAATYTASPVYVDLKMSIASSSATDFLIFSGSYAI